MSIIIKEIKEWLNTGVQCGEPLRLHGEHLSGGEDQLLREEGGRVPEDGGHELQGGEQVLPRRRLLRRGNIFKDPM